tara:strand:- start:64 stop:207 length:144 start_codon:yes stop_codon:yes gene_type:complete
LQKKVGFIKLAGLVERGSFTLWLSLEAIGAWRYAWSSQRGLQYIYSD